MSGFTGMSLPYRLNKKAPQSAEFFCYTHCMLKADNRTIQKSYTKAARSFDWAEGYMLNVFGLQKLRRRMFAGLKGDVLEVGAGTGLGFSAMPAGVNLVGLDLTASMLDIARTRASKYGATLVQGDALRLPFADNSFDGVVDALCLCTYPDPQQALTEMARVLKPDGRIVLIEHGLARPDWLQKFQHWRAESHFKTFCCRWDMNMDDVVAASGLKVLKSRRTFLGAIYLYELTL